MSLDLAAVRARVAAYRASHDHPAAFACCTAHASADDVPNLLAEVERVDLAELHRTLAAVRYAMATSARDWSLSKQDAWLYAIFVGWNDDPEDPDYDPEMPALMSIGRQHGWSRGDLAQLEAMHASIAALDKAVGA